MKKLFLCIATALACSAVPAQSLIEDALRINGMTEGRESAIKEFNDRYLTIREGSSLVDTPHILYPDSTFYGTNRLDDNILPLAFGFVPEEVAEDVTNNVIAKIRSKKYRADVSPEVEPYVLSTLYKTGHNEMAYFICEEHPEMKTDDCISEKYKKEWMEQCVAGITAMDKGRTKVRIRPDFSIQELDTLSWTAALPCGEVSSSFDKDLMHAEWYFSIPRGVKAEIYTPVLDRKNVKKRCFARKLREENGWTVWKVRGGRHHFSIDFEMPEYVVEKQFVYKNEDFPQCHASTLCFAENGDLLAAFYGGTAEHNPDTKARLCRKDKGTDFWTRPVVVAEPDKERYCLDNPVLFRIPEPGEPVRLWYKIRPGYNMKEGVIDISTIHFWEARMKTSYDNGRTWSEMEPMPTGFLGPIKNKPVYRDGRLICPSSFEAKFEHEGHRIHFEWTDDKCKTWHLSEPDGVEMSIPTKNRMPGRVGENKDNPKNPNDYYGVYRHINSIQPTIFIHKDGSLQALCRTGNSKMSCTWSYDNGQTWTKEVLTDMPQNGSGIDGTTLPDGRFVLAYNKFESLPGIGGGPRTPLVVAVSEDGTNWTDVVTLEDDAIKEYSYPCVICDDEGYVHIAYTWRRYRVKYVKLKL